MTEAIKESMFMWVVGGVLTIMLLILGVQWTTIRNLQNEVHELEVWGRTVHSRAAQRLDYLERECYVSNRFAGP